VSTNKFFTLIHGDAVHIAPETKVLPSEAFSDLADSKEVLDKVKKDAKQYREEVTQECEKLKEKAQKDGFEEGFTQWTDRIVELENEIKRVRGDLEKVVIPAALKAAKKIVGKELEISKKAIIDIVTNTLKTVATHKKVALYVSPDDLELVEKNREELKKIFESLEALSIRPRKDISQGGCVVETEGGIINAQLENQWLILENAFQKLMKQQPAPEEQKEVEKK